jgi:hypothetical protein
VSARFGWLWICGVLFAAPAFAQDDARAPVQAAQDGGTTLSAEDQEIVQNLDLLENLDASQELDTLLAMDDAQQDDAQASGDASGD